MVLASRYRLSAVSGELFDCKSEIVYCKLRGEGYNCGCDLKVKECCSGLAGSHRQEEDFIPKNKTIDWPIIIMCDSEFLV